MNKIWGFFIGFSILIFTSTAYSGEPEIGSKDHHRRIGVSKDATPDEIFSAIENLCQMYNARKGGSKKPIREFLETAETLLDLAVWGQKIQNLRSSLGNLQETQLGMELDLTEIQYGRQTPLPSLLEDVPSKSPRLKMEDSLDPLRSRFKKLTQSEILKHGRSHSIPYAEYLRFARQSTDADGFPSKAILQFSRAVVSRALREIIFRRGGRYGKEQRVFIHFLKNIRSKDRFDEKRLHSKPMIRRITNDLLVTDLWLLEFQNLLLHPAPKRKSKDGEKVYQYEEDSSLLAYRARYKNFFPPERVAVELGEVDESFARGLLFRLLQDEGSDFDIGDLQVYLAWMSPNSLYWLARLKEISEAFSELETSRASFESEIRAVGFLANGLSKGDLRKSLVNRCWRNVSQVAFVFKSLWTSR